MLLSGSDAARSLLERVGVELGVEVPEGVARLRFEAGVPEWRREDLRDMAGVADGATLAWVGSHHATDAPHLLAVYADGQALIVYLTGPGAIVSKVPFGTFSEAVASYLLSAERAGSDWSFVRLGPDGEFAMQRQGDTYGAVFPSNFPAPQDLAEGLRVLMDTEPRLN